MPFIDSELLFQLPVETTDGRALGRVAGIDIDVDSQSILRYHVRAKGIVAGMLQRRDLLISRGQVVSITKEKMVVESGMIEDEARVRSGFARVDPVPSMQAHASSLIE